MPRNLVTAIAGIALAGFGIYSIVGGGGIGGLVPLLIGGALIYLGYCPGRVALLVFGHACMVVGAMLITWGIYLLPHSRPVWQHIFLRPLFWGFISVFGGICAIYHGFCGCIRREQA